MNHTGFLLKNALYALALALGLGSHSNSALGFEGIEREQSCEVDVRVLKSSNHQVSVSASCLIPGKQARLIVLDNASKVQLCDARFSTSPYSTQLCVLERDPNHKLEYTYDLETDDFFIKKSAMIYKDPSFNFAPVAQYTMSGLEFTPPAIEGKKWEVNLSVRVIDNDVDPTEGRGLIPVELVDAKTYKVIETKLANTGETVSFYLSRSLKKSWPWIGKAKYVGPLQPGENQVFARVRDAYSNVSPIAARLPEELQVVTIRVPEDAVNPK